MKQPSLIYISGKTCTGKTTLSKRLSEEHGYPIIELDTVINSLHSNDPLTYVEAYQGNLDSNIVQSFIKSTIDTLYPQAYKYGGVIFEGAIANPEILTSIIKPWTSNFHFIYLHPVNKDVYIKQIISRFEKSTTNDRNGLPVLLWDKFTNEQLSAYYEERILNDYIIEGITSYAKDSMEESARRLNLFSSYFADIDVREV